MLDPVGVASGGGSVVGDVREALAGLGYGPDEIRDVLRDLPSDDGADASSLLRDALEVAGSPSCVTSSSTRASRGDAEDVVEAGLRPAAARRLRRSARAQGAPGDRHRGRPPARPGRRPPALRRATRARQDHAGRHRRRRDGRHPARHVGPGARAGRRPGRHPHQARRARRAVHRRDPPAVARRRGDPLPGDGGLPARHRRRARVRRRRASA